MESRRKAWGERVAGWRRSGLTAKEYAARIGVNAGTLAHWAWRLGDEQREQRGQRTARAAAAAAVIEVVGRQGGGAQGFELRLEGGRQLQIPASFDAAALTRLLEVLEGRR